MERIRTEKQQRKYEQEKAWNERNRDKMREYYKNYYAKNRKECSRRSMAWAKKNRELARQRAHDWYHALPEEKRDLKTFANRLWTNFRRRPEWYTQKLQEQSGGCGICSAPPGHRRLAVDHDHTCCSDRKKTCGKCVRGLLCDQCNTRLGHVEEILGPGLVLSEKCTGWAAAARVYLEKYPKEICP